MKRTACFVLVAIAICQAAAPTLDQNTLKGYLNNGAPFDFILVDLRSEGEITAAIGNESCRPYNLVWPVQFKEEVARIPKDQTVVVYCQSGGRSRGAAAYLEANGYTHVYNAGGFMTWDGPTVAPGEVKPASLLPEPSMKAKHDE